MIEVARESQRERERERGRETERKERQREREREDTKTNLDTLRKTGSSLDTTLNRLYAGDTRTRARAHAATDLTDMEQLHLQFAASVHLRTNLD